jgi:hypothetical protein
MSPESRHNRPLRQQGYPRDERIERDCVHMFPTLTLCSTYVFELCRVRVEAFVFCIGDTFCRRIVAIDVEQFDFLSNSFSGPTIVENGSDTTGWYCVVSHMFPRYQPCRDTFGFPTYGFCHEFIREI